MNSQEILERLKAKEKELEAVKEAIAQAEKSKDEKKIEIYNEEKILIRKEISTLLKKLPVSDQIKYDYQDTVKNIFIEIGAKGLSQALVTASIGVGSVAIIGLGIRYYRGRLVNLFWKVPQRWYNNTTQKIWSSVDAVNPISAFKRWKDAQPKGSSSSSSSSSSSNSSWISAESVTNQIKSAVNNVVPGSNSVNVPKATINTSFFGGNKSSDETKPSTDKKVVKSEETVASNGKKEDKDSGFAASPKNESWVSSIQNMVKDNLPSTKASEEVTQATENKSWSDSLQQVLKDPLSSINKKVGTNNDQPEKKGSTWSESIQEVVKDPISTIKSGTASISQTVSSVIPTWNKKDGSEEKSQSSDDKREKAVNSKLK